VAVEPGPAGRAGEGFLSAEQQRRYGRYTGEPDQAQLDRYFHLDSADRDLVDARRGEHNRLGFAVQLGTVRFLGTFLPDPTGVPWAVAAHLASQLGVADPGALKQYAARDGTNRLHAGQIRRAYGYRDFTDPQVQRDLLDWLQARTRLASERPGVLFDLATARLLEAKVLLPGPTVLARLVASVRDQAATRLWEALAAAPDDTQQARLAGLLAGGDGGTSTLERLRRGPTSVTAAGLLGALGRLEEIRALGVGDLDLSFVPPGRLEALARYATTARAQAVARMGDQRRTATCSPRPDSWRPTPATTPWTCSTNSWAACSPAPTEPACGSGCGPCRRWTWPPASSATPSRSCSTHQPAAYLQSGRRSGAPCPASSCPPPSRPSTPPPGRPRTLTWTICWPATAWSAGSCPHCWPPCACRPHRPARMCSPRGRRCAPWRAAGPYGPTRCR